MAGRFDNKKDGPQRGKVGPETGQQEEAQEEVQQQEPEHARLQNQVGNQALGALIGANQSGDHSGAGMEIESVRRKKTGEKEGPQLGGDDDGDGDGLLTLEDLSRSWNPGIKKSQDRPAFLEPMPDDELPPEDDEWLESVRGWPDPAPLPPTWTVDGLLQPSSPVVSSSLAFWTRGVARWAAPSLAWRTAALMLYPAAPALQDPDGRVLLSRARASAIGCWLLLSTPSLAGGATASTAAFVEFCLELDGRDPRMHAMTVAAGEAESKLPLASRLFAEHVALEGGRVQPVRLPAPSAGVMAEALTALLDLPDPTTLAPDLELGSDPDEEEEEEDDDPLGINAVIEELTGGPVDREEALYKSAIAGAERMASFCARLRVRFAGLGAVIAEVASMWSAGAPMANLRAELESLDRDVAGSLQMLVEIARAAQTRQVPPPGLRTGLRRAARRIARVQEKTTESLVAMIGGILPGEPSVVTRVAPPPDPLAVARADGRISDALGWLDELEPGLDRDVALLFVRASAGEAPARLEPLAEAARAAALAASEPALAAAVGVLLGCCYLRTGQLAAALALSAEQMELGRQRRNGVVLAEAALLGMEAHRLAGDAERLERLRGQAGNLLWRMGADGGLSLLSRWQPPANDEGEQPPLPLA